MEHNNINIDLAKEKGLVVGNDTSIYDSLSKKYKYLLEYYLNSLIDFNKYEELIDNSALYIGKNNKYKKINEYLNLNYIFLITHVFIEKLDSNELDMLKKFDGNTISSDLIEMISRTYKDVIRDNYIKGKYQNDIYKVYYGPFIPDNFVDNDVLVFKIYYGKNLKEILDTDEFITLNNQQLEFFNNLINKLKNEIETKLQCKCKVLLEKNIYEG